MTVERLHPDDVAAVADAVVARLLPALGALDDRRPRALVDAAELAEHLGVERSFVYEHADALGAVRLGDGPKARLRFDVDEAASRYASKSSHAVDAPSGGGSAGRGGRRAARLPNRLPEPGSVLAVKPLREGERRAA